jgi:propane monooxygenase reductase subunit
MAPLWSILNDIVNSGEQRPVRLYYGARARRDLFYLDEIASIAAKLDDFEFIPALSEAAAGDNWDGATGFIHDVLARAYAERVTDLESYACGPPPMVDALLPVFQKIGIDADNIHLDKFTQATA